jgi:hypothetical protein
VKKCALSSSKVRAALKKQTAGRSPKSYRELERKIQVHHNTIKKYLPKMEVHRKSKKSALKTTARQQTVIKVRLTQNFFSAKLIYKCLMDDRSYFTIDGNEWQQQSYYESEDHPATEDAKFNRKTKFSAKVLLWLAVSECGISELVFFKASLAVTKEVYLSKCLAVVHKCIQKHHKNKKIVFWRLHTTQRIRWSDYKN